jgi:alpha-amylase/alpha-mannosidase (GH57 family)
VHGHFYQPPRENPWLEEVELQDSAHPYHDWNERITAECYAPNTVSRILDDEHRIIALVNNYARINFNFGPTLLSWMEDNQPDVYQAILDADALSRELFDGHGSAIAQVYNHMIMPLANRRDKETQVRWGLEDFRTRFGRDPEGMWLPETAVDLETLDILADHGIRYTILAPRQASRVRRLHAKGKDKPQWQDVSDSRIDPTTFYVQRLPSGRTINLFFYDGPISQDMAFGGLLRSGESLRDRFVEAFSDDDRDWPQLAHVATDGETYGHHQHNGDMALAYFLHLVEQDESVELTNYGRYQALHEPVMEVEIFEDSSWSCIHGVERWRSDCGCNSGGHPGWNQQWRHPLRESLNWLRDKVANLVDELSDQYLNDPWAARDDYIRVILNRDPANVALFLERHGAGELQGEDRVQALKLLELMRYSQLIFTSCAWFFDEISGIETVQILQYAARTLQLAEHLSGESLEEEFHARMAETPSNIHENAAKVFEDYAKAAKLDMMRVGAHYAISSIFEEYPEEYDFACYTAASDIYNRHHMGPSSVTTGKVRITNRITLEQVVLAFAVLHHGDHNITCGVRHFQDFDSFKEMQGETRVHFERGDIADAVRLMDNHFMRNIYSVWHLFKDEQRKVVNELLAPVFSSAEASYRQLYENNYSILNFLRWLTIPVPPHLRNAVDFIVLTDLKRLFEHPEIDLEQLENLAAEVHKWDLGGWDESLRLLATTWINQRMDELEQRPEDVELLGRVKDTLRLCRDLDLHLNVWKAQNVVFAVGRDHYEGIKAQANQSDAAARDWLSRFHALEELLGVKVS